MVAGVGDVHVAAAVDGYAVRRIELSIAGRAVVPAEPRACGAGDGGDVAGRCGYLAYPVVAGVGEVDIASAVHRHSGRLIELRAGCRASISAEPWGAGASDSGDEASRCGDFADTMVERVADVDIASAVNRNAGWSTELGAACGAAVTAAAAAAGDGGDDARGGVDTSDPVVAGVADVDVAGAVDYPASHQAQLCGDCRSTITIEPTSACSSHGGNRLGQLVNPSNLAAEVLGNQEIPGPINDYPDGEVELCAGGETTVTAAAAAGDGGDDVRRDIDPPDPVVAGVSDVEVVQRVDRDAVRGTELRAGGEVSVAAEPWKAGTGYRGDDAGRGGDLTDPGIADIGDVDVSGTIDGDRGGVVQICVNGGAVVSPRGGDAITRNRGDDPRYRTDFPDPVVAGVGDVDVSSAVNAHS